MPRVTDLSKQMNRDLSDLYDRQEDLWLDILECAAARFLQSLKRQIAQRQNRREQAGILVRAYALGSAQYPATLSLYIDLWKAAKEPGGEEIKQRLCGLYEGFIQTFCEVAASLGLKEEKREPMACIFTVLSDALHLQSVLFDRAVPFEEIGQLLEEAFVDLLLGGQA